MKSFDVAKNEIVSSKVTVVLSHIMPGYYVINNDLKITATNPIWAEGSWTYPGSLRIGDKLMDSDKKDVIVKSIKYVNKEVIVYNLQIENTETYFASGIGVHNLRVGTK